MPESLKDQKASIGFGQAMASMSVGQRFCVTKKGHLGKVPVHARRGDRTCFLFRSRAVCTSSFELSERYVELVGGYFVHGCMRGESAAGFDDRASVFNTVESFSKPWPVSHIQSEPSDRIFGSLGALTGSLTSEL